MFIKHNLTKVVQSEIHETQLALLQAHTNHEHWEAQVGYLQKKLRRLIGTAEAVQNSISKDKDVKSD